MNPFLLSNHELLSEWKDFRKSLPSFSEAEQLEKVALFWAQAPLMKFAYDAERPDEWGTPWEQLDSNDWDRNSLAVGMEFTLRLSGWDASRLKLQYIRDPEISNIVMVLKIDDIMLLNYYERIISPLPNHDYGIIFSWQHDGKKYVERF